MSDIKIPTDQTFYDLLNVDFITSKETLLNEMIHARRNINAINNYLLACVHKLAQLTEQKVFEHEVTYTTTFSDYYIGKDKDEIEVGPNALHYEIIEYGDGNWEENSLKEVADYTKKEI